MEMPNFGTNDPLAVKLWSKSLDVEALGKSVVPTRSRARMSGATSCVSILVCSARPLQ
jgi:hypothetical protein